MAHLRVPPRPGDLRRAGALVGAVIALVGAVIVSAGAFGGSASAQTAPTVTLTPSSGFQDQQIIEVSVGPNTLFQAGQDIKILECADGASGVNQCDSETLNADSVTAASDGSFDDKKYQIFALPSAALGEPPSSKPVCDATHECELYVGVDQNDFSQPMLFSSAFTIGAATTTTTGATTTTTVATTTTTIAPAIQLNSTVSAGQALSISGSDFIADASLQVQLSSTPGTIGAVAADSSGAFQTTVTIPAATNPGTHTITVGEASGGDQAQFLITVTAAGATTSTGSTTSTTVGGALSLTGTDARRSIAAALGIIGVGLLLLAAGWRSEDNRLRRRTRRAG